MITVSDSTPLIHFGTIKRLDLLRSMYGQIVITEAVHREVVTEGIALGKMDANLFGKGDWGLDRCHKSGRVTRVKFAVGTGYTIVEAESILLAREPDADLLLINERDGRRAAKNAGVKVNRAIGVISDCIE